MKERTIAALSTPLGSGGICVVRMSGDASLEIAKKVFTSKSLDYKSITPRLLYLGKFNTQSYSDECLMVYFKSPNSYTGEDIVEFQCHGGNYLAERILDTLLNNGAKLAENGEFTKRAFINGKVSLDKAEGIIDVINAESENELKAVNALTNGTLFKKIKDMQNNLTEYLAKLEVALDYPEHDIEQETINETKKYLFALKSELESTLKNSADSKLIKNGVNIAIVGSPNVGKSSILNALLGEDRAIVTDIAGTTRDTLKESIVYKGVKFNFIDTAGLRKSNDIVETIGIEKAKKQIEEADIILVVLDSTKKITDEEISFINSLENKNYLIIYNKIDKKCDFSPIFDNFLEVSAKDNYNIDLIKEKILENTIKNKIDFSKVVLTNKRHISTISEALDYIANAMCACDNLTADIVAFEIKNIWNTLGKITGQTENEDIIDMIFSKFCLGK